MDIFAATVTSLTLLYNFIDSCAEFPGSAKGLSLRLQWDTRLLQRIQDYFASRQTINSDGSTLLSPEDERLLKRVAEYLDELIAEARAIESKIGPASRWKKGVMQMTWWHYRPKFEGLQQELHEWATKFDVHLIALPQDMKEAIQLRQIVDRPNVLITTERIGRVIQSVTDVDIHSAGLLIEDPAEILATESTHSRSGRTSATFRGTQVLVEYRPYSQSVLSEANKTVHEVLVKDQKRLAVILSHSQSTSLGLPKCKGYFDNDTFGKPHFATFALIYELPFAVSPHESIRCLRDVIDESKTHRSNHTLSDRFKFAHRLSVAVLLIHSSNWVHESINPANVVVLEPEHLSTPSQFPRALGHPLLLGFQAARSAAGDSAPLMGSHDTEANIYKHPHRIPTGSGALARFVRAYDMYSLGVVLLELGLWRRVSHLLQRLGGPANLHDHLGNMVDTLKLSMGNTYANVVRWCLERDEEHLEVDEIMKAVVERLEHLAVTV